MTTVKQLIDSLRNLPEDANIVMAKDAEGNGFIQNCDAALMYIHDDDKNEYQVDSVFSMEEYEADQLSEEEWDEEYERPPAPIPVVVLWP